MGWCDMKLIELVNASASMQKLITQDLPLRTAYQVVLLVDKCNPHLAFYGNEIRKAKTDDQVEELNSMDVPEAFDRITIPLTTDIRLSAADVKCLEPFIDWGDGI